MIIKAMRKKYWKRIILNGYVIPWMCDGYMLIDMKVKKLYTDEEWESIILEYKQEMKKIRDLIDDLD